jgi:plastocyanin
MGTLTAQATPFVRARRPSVRRSTLGLFATTALLLAGCTTVPDGAIDAQALECPPGTEGCDEIRPVGPGGELEVEMDNFYFNVVDGAPVTGDITVTAVNLGAAYHNIEFLGAAEGSTFMGGSDGDAVVGADGNETGEGIAALFPGEWTMICNVPGHRAAGMESTVTVYATEEEAQAAIEAGETDVDRDAEMPQG